MLRVAVAISLVLVRCSVLHATEPSETPLLAAPAPTEAEAAVLAALDQPTSADFDEHPLSEAIAALSHMHKIEIQFDSGALTDSGVPADTPVNMKLAGIRLRSALRLMLAQLDLTYVVRDGYLLITSKTEAENMLKVRAYAVRDLVTADNPFLPAPRSGPSDGHNFQSLSDLITSTVAPHTWNGGSDISGFDNTDTISFFQTDEVHEEAAELLAALRRVRDKQLAAAKTLPGIAGDRNSSEEVLRTYVYRLVPWPRYMSWLYHGGFMTGMGGGGMAVGMGGGMFAVANQNARPDEKSTEAASKEAQTSKSDAGNANKPTVMLQFDVEQCERWTKELASDLPDQVEPKSWRPNGEGSVRLLAGALVIRQTPEMHERIVTFLAELLPMRVVTSAPTSALAVRLPAPGPRLDWPHEAEPRNEARIEAALAKQCDVDFREMPLAAAMQSLVANTPIKLWIDKRAFQDAGISPDTPVTRSIHGASIRSALKLILAELDLAYVIRDEVLVITSESEAECMLVTKVYPVFDLVANTSGWDARHTPTPFRPIQPASGMASGARLDGYQALIANIVASIPPSGWDEVSGGPGAIREFRNSGALVISHTTLVHEQIAEYLRALRQLAAAQR